MKHAHVNETLLSGAGFSAPSGRLDEGESEGANEQEPVEKPSRVLFECDGATWIERDPVTGRIIATGTVGEL